ncbi:MAG TPA: aromatic ring-hydroxylating dioxygenase subunit alpha [Gaiella sp.]|uniref:aromatic ring-hydroxylating oxygenase subunit alpha n=1 Tax=Gaiella sp. TaxID=2663207 RepID=UPI002D7F0B83|nr:aromatic ring-hydroxylating dioxygenase subunit alpha [Gaiella sp.]HET9287027.1 aromatic ring-hydroxylating dioxygenase subunit alpha [Gaiella sp.]
MATVGGTRTLPYEWYSDPAVLRLEQERIFARSWQYAARFDQVAEPGQLTTAYAGTLPVVLARARDGQLRGFVNVCRHRGNLLCEGDARRETIQCPYHAWTYDLDGALRHAPRADREPGFDASSLGLVPVAVDAWGPFVFVNPDTEAEPLAGYLGELPRLLAADGLDVDELRFHARAESDEYVCNWKVCVENFLECYHCAVAHPTLAKALNVSPEAYGLEARGRLASQFGVTRNGGGGVYDASGQVEGAQFHLLFPGTVVNVMPGPPNLSIGPVVPRGPERTYRFLDYFVAPDVDEGWTADYLALDEQVGAEDRRLVESVQRGIASGGLEAGTLLPESEKLIAHFQALVLEALAADPGSG